jgi:hypothetical protein
VKLTTVEAKRDDDMTVHLMRPKILVRLVFNSGRDCAPLRYAPSLDGSMVARKGTANKEQWSP